MKNNGQKALNMFLSLALALVLWGYCVVEVNPSSNDSIKNIPITYDGIQELNDAGLTIVSGQLDTINIAVAGQRSRLSAIKKSDFKVICEVKSLVEGENRVALAVKIPDGVTIETQSVKNLVLKVEKIVTQTKPIIGIIVNQDADSDTAEILSLSKETVKVTGAESLVNAVKYVSALIDATLLGNEVTVMDVTLTPVDVYHEVVDKVSLGRASVTCRAVLRSPNSDITDENPDVDIDIPDENDDNQDDVNIPDEQNQGEGQNENDTDDNEGEGEGESPVVPSDNEENE